MLLRLVLAVANRKLETVLKEHFDQPDIRVESLGRARNPFQRAVRTNGDILIIDADLMPRPIESSISLLNGLPENPTTIVLHDSDSPAEHANLVTLGADVVLYSGLPQETLVEAIETTLESRRHLSRMQMIGSRPGPELRMGSIVAESPQMKIFMDMVEKILVSNAPVLILGETGVGKELLAKVIHAESARSKGPFVAVNCAALPDQLLESELFGHEEGSFTGAVRARRGAFELAHGGTIFLDEIGDLPLHLQAKLLRVLQEFEVRPVGSEKSIWVDNRVIAATNRKVDEEAADGSFRRDLYYRLSVITLTVPPLRQRREDIPPLVEQYLDQFRVKLNKDIEGVSAAALEALAEYEWPGNVRELINVLERAAILCQGEIITLDDLPQGISGDGGRGASLDEVVESLAPGWRGKSLPEVKRLVLDAVERAYLNMALDESRGRVGEAARRAGIHPRGLFDKMRRHGLRKEDFKPDR